MRRQVRILEEACKSPSHSTDARRLDEFVKLFILTELLLEEEIGLLKILDVVMLHFVHAHCLLKFLGQLIALILTRLVGSRVVTIAIASTSHWNIVVRMRRVVVMIVVVRVTIITWGLMSLSEVGRVEGGRLLSEPRSCRERLLRRRIESQVSSWLRVRLLKKIRSRAEVVCLL